MKALLFTVIIILVFLLIIAYYLNQYTVKKPVLKEEFFGGGGDVYALQSGQNEFQTITKLESDVNNIIVKQEQNTLDLTNFKSDANKQFSTLNTGLAQFKTDASGKLSVLQETSTTQGSTLSATSKNLTDLTNNVTTGFKSTNDALVVINGQLVSITGAQQKRIDSLTNNYNTLSQQQATFPTLIDSKNKVVLDKVNTDISKLTTNLNDAIANETGLINNATNQISTLQQDYQTFKTSASQTDSTQQSSINQLLTSAASLNDAINAAQKRINDVAATFGNYISKDQTGNFVVKADLQPYATQNQLKNYALNTVTAEFITFNELGRYVTKTDNQPTIDGLKTVQQEYVSKNKLQPTIDALNAANAALGVLSNTVRTISGNYVTKTDLPKLVLQEGGVSVLTQALDGMKGNVTTLTNSISEIKASLTKYVLKDEWNVANKTFALKNDLNIANSQITAINNNIAQNVAMKGDLKNYVQLSQMPKWPTKADIDALTANFNAQIASIKGGTSQILNTLQVNNVLNVDQINATKGLWNTKMPSGWIGGVHTMDLYGEGTVAAGKNGIVNAYINADGNARIAKSLGVGIDPSQMGGSKFRVETPTGDWQNFFHNPNGDRYVVMNHGDGLGLHVNTNDQRADRWNQQYHNGKWVLHQTNNDGLNYNDSKTGDWAWRMHNQNGDRWAYINHGAGYGMHINPNDGDGGKYALQTIGANRETLTVFNDGQKRWQNRSGNWTHFDHPDEKGKNYIRGPTQFDGPYTRMNGNISTPNGHTIGNEGRQHISAGEILYLLPKNGVSIGKEWGGTGDLRVQGNSSSMGGIDIANKWRLTDTGDDWMRLNNVGKNGTNDYRGGLATANLYSRDNSYLNGNIALNGNTTLDGKMRINANITTPNGHTIGNEGRQHISAGEILYLLPKNGVSIGKEWGGTGDLRVQGQISTPDIRAGPNTTGKYPGGWGGGVMAWDVYAGGTIAMGDLNGKVDRGMNRGGSWGLSDIRRKENISNLSDNELNAINNVNPIKFTKKDDETKKIHFGYSAQDIEKIYPNLIEALPDGYKGMNYEELIPIIAGNVKNIKQNLPDKETLCLGDVCINKDQLRQIKYALESKAKA